MSTQNKNDTPDIHERINSQNKNQIRSNYRQGSHEFRLVAQNRIFNAEALAVENAIKIVNIILIKAVSTLTDSLSTLKSVKNEENTNEITHNTINLLNNSNKQITLTRIPSHIRIDGNKRADLTAKRVTSDITIETRKTFSKDDPKNDANKSIANV